MRKNICYLILLIFTIPTFAQINDIFVGNFLTFDPYFQPPEELEQNWKSFDNNKLFIHLSDEVFFDSSDAQEVVYYENMYGTISNMASSMDSFTVGTINFTIGMPFFFIYQGKKYSTSIELFILFGCYKDSAGLAASCFIPEEIIDIVESDCYQSIICSIREQMVLYFDGLDPNRQPRYVTDIGDYRIISKYEETEKLDPYGNVLYDTRFAVTFRNKLILEETDGPSPYPYKYLIGDFNGNGRMNIFLSRLGWIHDVWIYEFKGAEYKEKTRRIYYVD